MKLYKKFPKSVFSAVPSRNAEANRFAEVFSYTYLEVSLLTGES